MQQYLLLSGSLAGGEVVFLPGWKMPLLSDGTQWYWEED